MINTTTLVTQNKTITWGNLYNFGIMYLDTFEQLSKYQCFPLVVGL